MFSEDILDEYFIYGEDLQSLHVESSPLSNCAKKENRLTTKCETSLSCLMIFKITLYCQHSFP